MTPPSIELLSNIEDRASWLAIYQVHWANNKAENKGRKPKVGGHQASVTSSSTILTALYMGIKRPQDRIAVKPHAAPFMYSLMYLMDRVNEEQMKNLREFRGLQPYPTQHTNPDFVDYSTSIEGLGVAAVIEDAYVAYVQNDQLDRGIDARYHAHVGDGELTELQIGGSLHEAGRRRLGNVRWWVDVNRQTLDRIVEDSPHGTVARWARALFEANGWNVIELRWGQIAKQHFAKADGHHLQERLDCFDDAQYQPLLLVPDDVLRSVLLGETEHSDPVYQTFLQDFKACSPIDEAAQEGIARFLSTLDNEQLRSIIEDLGGHDLEAMLEANEEAEACTDKPTAILCHTIKGWRLPGWQGHPENHGALLNDEQVQTYRELLKIPGEQAFPKFEENSAETAFLAARSEALFPPETREVLPYPVHLMPSEEDARILFSGKRSTSAAFGQLNTRYMKSDLGPYLHFIAPDVGLTTHLGGVITSTGVYEHRTEGVNLAKFLIDQRKASFAWRLSQQGHFHSVAINEGVAAMKLFAFGRRHMKSEGKVQYISIGTIYDIFWKHAYTQVYYGLYDNARFIAVGTPSGTSLSRESGTHQSVQTPAIMAGMPGIIALEPAYALDTAVLYRWAIEQMNDDDGESVYLRLSTQDLLQPVGKIKEDDVEKRGLPALEPLPQSGSEFETLKEHMIQGAYWLHHPMLRGGDSAAPYMPNANVAHIYATGAIMEEALRASKILEDEHGIYAPVLNVTSWDRLYRDYRAFWCDKERWNDETDSFHLNELIPDVEFGLPTVVVADALPMQAEWLGNALGRPARVLGPTEFSEVGDVSPLRAMHKIDSASIVAAIREELAAG